MRLTCRCCGGPLPVREAIAYGGSLCETCAVEGLPSTQYSPAAEARRWTEEQQAAPATLAASRPGGRAVARF